MALGFRWEALPMDRKSLNPLQELRLLMHLCRLYRREQPDLAHHFTIKCVVYGSIAALVARVPARVNAVAGMGYVFTNQALKARLLRPVVRGLHMFDTFLSKFGFFQPIRLINSTTYVCF